MSRGKSVSIGLRVIGGERRGKKLFSPPGSATRPTSSRVRESIYNILSNTVADAVVLDLFAGTGILGIEALSRGANYAVFIDNDQTPAHIIKKNLAACRFEHRAKVIRHDIKTGLKWLPAYPAPINLVFMDPPYNKGFIGNTLAHLRDCAALASPARIVVEHAKTEPLPDILSEFTVTDQRRYGKTLVSFINYII